MPDVTPGDDDLVRSADEYARASQAGAAHTVRVQSLEALMDTARHHFRREEEVMQRASFSGMRRHAAAHRSIFRHIVESLHRLRTKIDEPRLLPVTELMTMIQRHIEEHDADLARFLKDLPDSCSTR